MAIKYTNVSNSSSNVFIKLSNRNNTRLLPTMSSAYKPSVPGMSRVGYITSQQTLTAASYSFSYNPPKAPTALVLLIGNPGGTSAWNRITGITYGGVSMTPVTSGRGSSTSYGTAAWELLSGIPAGTQGITASYNASLNDDFYYTLIQLEPNDSSLYKIYRQGAGTYEDIGGGATIYTFDTSGSVSMTAAVVCLYNSSGATFADYSSQQTTLAIYRYPNISGISMKSCVQNTASASPVSVGYSTSRSCIISGVCYGVKSK